MDQKQTSLSPDKNLTNVVDAIEHEGVNAHNAQQIVQDKEDRRKRDIHNQRK
jgi:hypothetical protein